MSTDMAGRRHMSANLGCSPLSVIPGLDPIGANLSNYLKSVIPGLDPGTSFQEVKGWHPDFRLKSSRKLPPGGTRIKSGYDGKGGVFTEVSEWSVLC
jgi:hypothetical protein